LETSYLRQQKNPKIWHLINKLLVGAIVLVVCGFGALTFHPEWTRRNELATQLEAEQAKFAAEQLLQKQRAREVHLLQNDPEYVEMIARDKLGVMKEGETIFRLDAPKSPEPAPARAAAK